MRHGIKEAKKKMTLHQKKRQDKNNITRRKQQNKTKMIQQDENDLRRRQQHCKMKEDKNGVKDVTRRNRQRGRLDCGEKVR